MQCRRAHLPTLSPATTFAAAAALPGASLATHGGDVPALDHPLVLIGPEGGWSPAEVEEPLPHIGLGPHVLRSETAAIAAATLLAAARERCT
jgi:16S rRNA (uracil1498-N3)-methyltransferase